MNLIISTFCCKTELQVGSAIKKMPNIYQYNKYCNKLHIHIESEPYPGPYDMRWAKLPVTV